MAQLRWPQTPRTPPVVLHVRAPTPLVFPEEDEVPETKTHLTLRTFLYGLLKFALGPEHSLGSDQFVYWNAADTKRCVAPDVFVKLGVPDRQFPMWQTWVCGGTPELAIEIVSRSDRRTLEEKLRDYHELGVSELVRFDPAAPENKRLRVWDRVEGDLVERIIASDRTPCLTLGLNWLICPVKDEPVGLRLVDDESRLLETEVEREARLRSESDARAEAEARARAAETARADAAEARLRQLEEELRRRSG